MVYALTMAALATVRSEAMLYGVMVIAGAAWVTVLSSLQVAAQVSVPAWVRGRALSLYIMVFSAGLTLGSLLWGGSPRTQAFPPRCWGRLRVRCWQRWPCADSAWVVAEAPDLSPSFHWPHPPAASELDRDRGPVLVTVEYEIELAQREAFLDAMQQLGTIRRRDGAFSWGVFEDIAVPGRYIELFQQDSWLDHLRQHARVTREDQRVQEIIHRFHIGAAAPRVSHFIGGAPKAFTDGSMETAP